MGKELISKIELDHLIDDLGDELTAKCHEVGGGIVFVCVMNGGFMFYSDLVKKIKYPIETSFLKCKSYDGFERKEITLDYIPSTDFEGKTVFIVDDILDSGNTMKAVAKFLQVKEPKTITPVAAIYKENLDFDKVLHILKQDTDSMFDPWYIGYGMDDEKGHNRNLGTIYTI